MPRRLPQGTSLNITPELTILRTPARWQALNNRHHINIKPYNTMHRDYISIPDYKQYMPDWENLPQGTKDNAIGAYLTLKWRAYNGVYYDWYNQQPPKRESYQELKQLLYDVFGRLALHPYTRLVFSALKYKTLAINTKTNTRGRVINVMYHGEEPWYELDTNPPTSGRQNISNQ